MSSPTETAGRGSSAAATRAVRYAVFARALSWLAGAIGIAAVLLFLVQAGLFSALAPKEEITRPTIGNPEQITSTDSTVTGLDRENQPYEVKAKRGWQDSDKPNIVHLEEIDAIFRGKGGKSYVMYSRTGVYDTKIKEMDLAGGITIAEGSRFLARMEQAHVAVESNALTSSLPVDVSFAGGTIHANGLQITDDGARILFLNGVQARFGVDSATGDQTP